MQLLTCCCLLPLGVLTRVRTDFRERESKSGLIVPTGERFAISPLLDGLWSATLTLPTWASSWHALRRRIGPGSTSTSTRIKGKATGSHKRVEDQSPVRGILAMRGQCPLQPGRGSLTAPSVAATIVLPIGLGRSCNSVQLSCKKSACTAVRPAG